MAALCGKRDPYVLALIVVSTLLSGCLTGPADSAGGADKVVCTAPYMRLADSCCLDRDGNGICDKDEAAPPTTQPPVEATETTQAPTTTIAPQTTSTLAQTTTTQAQTAGCTMNSDCGSQTTEMRCSDGDVVKYVQTPVCKNPGTPQANCISKVSTSASENCAEGTDCVNGACVAPLPVNCLQSCQDLEPGYSDAYCNSVPSCIGSDARSVPGDSECLTYGSGMYCCCQAEAEVTGTDSTTTTTTSGAGTHKECVGSTCKTVSGAGLNTCVSNLQCMGMLTTSTLKITHKECVGTSCKSVIGLGADQCSSNIQCIGGAFTTSSSLAVFHKECVGTSCQWVPGGGSNKCTSSLQCMSVVSTIPKLPTTTLFNRNIIDNPFPGGI
jgi:hypothetical protein